MRIEFSEFLMKLNSRRFVNYGLIGGTEYERGYAGFRKWSGL